MLDKLSVKGARTWHPIIIMILVCFLWSTQGFATLADATGVDPGDWYKERSISASADIMGLAYAYDSEGEHLLAAGFETDIIYALNPNSGAVLRSFPSPGTRPEGLTFDGLYLWCQAEGGDSDQVYKIDYLTGTVLRSFDGPGSGGNGLAWLAPSLYVNDTFDDTIYELDPTTASVRNSITFPAQSSGIGGGITFVENNLYWSDYNTGIIYSLDPRDGTVLGSFDSRIIGIEAMAYGNGELFVSDGRGQTIHVFVPEPATLLLLGLGALALRRRRRA